jgi:phosphatidylserine decarboxylase
MAESMQQWLRRVKKETKGMSEVYMASTHFFRDPIRPIKNNSDFIYSPADGILLDLVQVNNTNETFYSKYHSIHLDELAYRQIPDGNYWVATIFLTYYDPHVVRMPVSGIISRLNLPPYLLTDKPMLDIEQLILNNDTSDKMMEQVASVAYNQRVMFSVRNPFLEGHLYMILTADYDIDTVVSYFPKDNFCVNQNKRFGSIRYGSMVTCIIPANWNIQPIQKKLTHVEAGIDPLFKWN